MLLCSTGVLAQQVENSNFEDWSAAAFNGEPQAKGWNASNVEQVGMKFNFAHKETGHNGGYCMMVQDQSVGAMGITASSEAWRASLGVYQAAVKLAVIMNLFIQMFRYAAEPFFFQRAKDKGSKELYAVVMEYFTAFCGLVFVGVIAYIDIISLLLGKDFRVGIGVVPIMLLSYMLLGMLFNVSMWYKLSGRTNMAVWITLAGLAVTTVVNIVFMPRFSYWASAFAHLSSYFVMFVLSAALGQKYYPIPYKWMRLLAIFGLMGIAYLGMLYISGIPSIGTRLALNTGVTALYAGAAWLLLRRSAPTSARLQS